MDRVSEVYAASYRRLVVQLYAATGDLAEAQEAVQEAFVRALDKPRQFDALDNPEAWLRRVALNVARTRYRRRRIFARVLATVGPPPLVPDVGPDHVALMTALRRLPDGQRQAIALHYLADLPIEQVAEALDISLGTVKSRLSRGRAALAGLLDDDLVVEGS
jgi:RNA polymerase sigma-70 factor (sigma-E family)